MTKNIWKILTHTESLWVKWIHSYRLDGRNIWSVHVKDYVSWCWRKILLLRDRIRDYLAYKIGNSDGTSAWFDKWNIIEPLEYFVSNREITRAGSIFLLQLHRLLMVLVGYGQMNGMSNTLC